MNKSGLDVVAIAIAVINLVTALYRTNQVLGQNRIVTFAWALISYWSFFLLLLSVGGPFTISRGFTIDSIAVAASTIRFACAYALVFNLFFLVSEAWVWRLLGGARKLPKWTIDRNEGWLRLAILVYGIFLVGGAALYWMKTRGLGYYNGYVQFQGSNWPSVFLWASAPLITISVFQRRYALAIIATIPFIFFAVALYVRAFALLSVVPAMMIMYFQYIGKDVRKRKGRFRAAMAGGAAVVVLVALSNVVMYGKLDQKALSGLPDSGLVYGMNIVFEMTQRLHVYTGWNSMILYFQNIMTPFMKLFQIDRSEIQDTPVYMAYLVDGVPAGYSVFYHYPTLWYSDAFVSFGLAGVALAGLWGAVLSSWEAVMVRRPMLMALLLPFYTFHTYMLIRGATAIAATPISYALYVAVLVILLLAPRELIKSELSSERIRVPF